MKILIIGGVAGGATAAARLRRLDEHAEIVLFERGEHVSYANCGLPYYIGDVIKNRDNLFVQTTQGFVDRFRIDVRTRSEVMRIDPAAKTVDVKNLANGETRSESYDKLILSPGAHPLKSDFDVPDDWPVFTLRDVTDTDRIKNFATERKPNRALVVGGGFIGLEMAENLKHLSMQVCIIQRSEHVMPTIDFSMAAILHQHLESKNVGLLTGEQVVGIEKTDGGLRAKLSGGKTFDCDMIVWSVGVRPEIRLAKDAGLKIGERGGITVDEHMQTSESNIYAIGDAVEVLHQVTGKPAIIPLAGPANKQGRIVADNIILGDTQKYPGSIGTAVAQVFDLTVASAGASAKLLRHEGIPYVSSYTHSMSHAGYYPGAKPLSVKILFSPEDGRLLGAQVIGNEGVDKRIDLFAQVIKNGGTTDDLTEIEHAYAPPYSSAKDPVNMAGFVAENILKKRTFSIHWRDIATLDRNQTMLIDVRTKDEFELGTIDGAVNFPLDELRDRLAELPCDKPLVLFCGVGLRGYLASRILLQHGFENVRNLSGGYKTYASATAKRDNDFQFETVDAMQQKQPLAPQNTQENASGAITVDACGLQCPGPIMQLKRHYEETADGQRLLIRATDPAFEKDVVSWCNVTGATLVSLENQSGTVSALIEKSQNTPAKHGGGTGGDHKTLIVFSDDLDKALASFVIANGAAAMGKKVSMFFTFWGLSVIKKAQKPPVSKDVFGKMFGWMLPSSSLKLKLSKMNMGGLGGKMMRYVMKRKNIESLESLMRQARDAGVEIIACTMSMDVMGVKPEELIDDVTLGGVATYLERAEEANVNLFI